MNDRPNTFDIIMNIVVILIILAFITFVIIHPVMWASKVGIPKDNPSIIEITFNTPGSSSVNVYGTSYQYIKDDLGNNTIIVTDCYEAGLFHWIYSAKQKSFYGDLVNVKYFNDKFYEPK